MRANPNPARGHTEVEDVWKKDGVMALADLAGGHVDREPLDVQDDDPRKPLDDMAQPRARAGGAAL